MNPKIRYTCPKNALFGHKYIEGFRLHCVAEGKSYQTTRWYAHKLGIFARYLERQHVVDDVAEVTTEHVRAFLVYLREEVRAGDPEDWPGKC